MRVLLTGATGFVGRNLLPALLHEHDVTVVVRDAVGLCAHPRLEVVIGDWASSIDLGRLPGRLDVVVHLAVAGAIFPEAAREMFEVNTTSTLRLLEYSHRVGVGHFVLASTGDIYGDSVGRRDETDPARPTSFYAVTKYASELLLHPYERSLTTCVLRLYHPYGPGQTNRLIPRLGERVRRGLPVRISRSGRPHVTPTYIDDVVHALTHVVRNRMAGVFNVAGETLLSIRDLAMRIADVLRSQITFEETGEETGDLAGDNTRIRQILAEWTRVGFEEGLGRMFDRMRSAEAGLT
jgi:nucleoside-diphosphate-sugar epimerase